MTHDHSQTSSCLNGHLILDCSTLFPGPLVGKLLQEQGARVVKIENPDQPDRARQFKAKFDDLNGKKEILFLNLKKEEDYLEFATLVKKASGLIEGFRPLAKKRLRIDEKSLHSLNPSLCIASLVGYPEDGPEPDRAGHDLNFAAQTGLLSLFQEMPALPLADLFSAYRGAFELVCALIATSSGSPGKRCVISMTETLEQVQSSVIADYQATKQLPKPETTLFSGKYPCYRIYRDKEGRKIAVGTIEEKFWNLFCEIIQLPDLKPLGYECGEKREWVIQQVQTALSKKSWHEWAPAFEKANCCVEIAKEYNEVY